MIRPGAFTLAVLFDWLAGEVPNAIHPVAWLGHYVHLLEHRAPRGNPRAEWLYGTGIAASGILISAAPAWILERALSRRSLPTRLLITAGLLKITFAWRALLEAGDAVRSSLRENDPNTARRALAALVSRDTSELDSHHLASAAIESLAENASDSFVAPLFYYNLFGLAGAMVYRAVNTMDAMIGYHGRYEYLGKTVALLDDLLNWIPSRMTAVLTVVASRLAKEDARRAWETIQREHGLTESPNAGYPMSAIAGALGVELEKEGHYRLGQGGRPPCPEDIRRAARVVSLALTLSVGLGLILELIRRKHWS